MGNVVADENASPLPFPLPLQSVAITIDGDLTEWGRDDWVTLPLHPAIEGDDKNRVGTIVVEMKGHHDGERIYLAARWPDSTADTHYKRWVWRGNRYRRGKEHDDMFAVRFEMTGDYDSCMLTNQTYSVDLWSWSAGRSNLLGYADDLTQQISSNLLEHAAEYEGPDGNIVYIKKRRDSGTASYKNTKPNRNKKSEPKLAGIEPNPKVSGSVADVQAKGEWRDGYWQLEMVRQLNTGHEDDIVLEQGRRVRGAIAVFNRSSSEHKSNSDTLLFELMH